MNKTFETLTSGQVAYLGQLLNQVLCGRRSHKKHGDAFFVEASELQVVFGAEYRSVVQPYMTCIDEDYDLKKCTKAFIFTDKAIECFRNLKPQEIVVQKRSTMDVEYQEKLNMAALDEVINNWTDLKPETIQQLILLRAQTSESGINYVWYRRTSGPKGRRFAGCVSLQGIPDRVRQAIIDVSYSDIDMVNAHPTLFLAFAKQLGLKHSSINIYVTKREQVLKKIMAFFNVSRDASKELMLQLSYGSGLKYSLKKRGGSLNAFTQWCLDHNAQLMFKDAEVILPDFLISFKAELSDIGSTLMKSDVSSWLPQAKRDYVSRGTALFLQSVEDEALEVIERWCAYKNITVMSLAFDGLIVEGMGHDFSECEMFINIMLKDIYGIDAGLKLKIKNEVPK